LGAIRAVKYQYDNILISNKIKAIPFENVEHMIVNKRFIKSQIQVDSTQEIKRASFDKCKTYITQVSIVIN